MAESVALSEAARSDLYNGLGDVLGPDRAETLMTQLPNHDPSDVATKADIAELKAEITGVNSGLAAVNTRLDRFYLTLVAGLFVMIAAMAGILFTTL